MPRTASRWLQYFLVLTSITTHAQTPQPDPETTTLHVSTKLVLLDASIDNKKTGQPIPNLQLSDFLLTEDGAPQPLTYFSQNQLPLSIVFLFDLTDSVRPVLKPLAAGGQEVLNHLKPEDEVSIAVFSSNATVLQEFTTDRSLAATAIAKAAGMKEGDPTFIHEDMYEAVDLALRSTIPGCRRVLVWLTDGATNGDNKLTKAIAKHAPATLHSKEEATNKLIHSGVVTSALIERSAMTDATIASAFLIGAHMGEVNHYAELTGGPVIKTSKPEVATKFAALLDEIRLRNTLGYRPTATKPEGTYCKLSLQLSPAFFARHPELKSKDIIIRTRQGYYR